MSACESLDPAFLSQERRELDPEPSRKLVAAMLRTREMQDNTDVGRTLAAGIATAFVLTGSGALNLNVPWKQKTQAT
ncbi:hypothetical protein B0H10DRAFT_2218265 [Mycena sp. CBHHK59/15]|nr:hypothetical protein B0H10DRAFT_2218265 [Mycena sp. CBHHK59/15]